MDNGKTLQTMEPMGDAGEDRSVLAETVRRPADNNSEDGGRGHRGGVDDGTEDRWIMAVRTGGRWQ